MFFLMSQLLGLPLCSGQLDLLTKHPHDKHHRYRKSLSEWFKEKRFNSFSIMFLGGKGGVCTMFGDTCSTFIANNTSADGLFTKADPNVITKKVQCLSSLTDFWEYGTLHLSHCASCMRHLWGLMNLSHTKQPHAWTTWHAPDWIPPYHNCKDEAKKSNLCKHLNLCIVCDHLEGHFTFQFRVLKPPGVQALMVLDFMLWGINSNQKEGKLCFISFLLSVLLVC